MSMPESPTRRRPVPPPKTESQARLREDLTSSGRAQRSATKEYELSGRSQNAALDPEAQKQDAMKHVTLPAGWNLRNEADVTYHTHVAKPVVHETVHNETTEIIEPRITREYHLYHQYDYIQPLEVEVPNNSYATNADGEVINAPGGLTTRVGQSSYWEQDRQDRGYGAPPALKEGQDCKRDDAEVGRDRTVGPFPIHAEGGGEQVLHGIREGRIARRFGGTLTSSGNTAAPPNQGTPADEYQTRPRGGGYEEAPQYQQAHPQDEPQTPLKDSFHSARRDSSTYHPAPHASPNSTVDLERNLNRLSLQQHPEAKPLPSLPDTSPRSPHSKGGVRRMSGDNKLRDRYSTDSSQPSLENQNPTIDDEAVPDRTSSARKTRMY